MKIFIDTDMEGVSLVNSIAMMDQGTDGYRFACDRLAADLNAAILGAFDGGADEVVFIDGHGSGKNLSERHFDAKKFPGIARATQLHGQSAADISGADAGLFIGMHAMSGTMYAFLDHTQSSVAWHDYKINGIRCGEFAQDVYWAGAHGVPYVMVSGDKAACAEAGALVNGIVCAEVKEARERNSCDCIDGETALARIRAAAAEGVRHHREIPAITLPLPAVVTTEFNRADYCEAVLRNHPDYLRTDARTLVKRIDKLWDFSDIIL